MSDHRIELALGSPGPQGNIQRGIMTDPDVIPLPDVDQANLMDIDIAESRDHLKRVWDHHGHSA